jgi:repressor LexA
MLAPNLTPKQKEILDFISIHRESHGFAPSQQEIARHFGFKSLGTVQNYLVRLERHGLLTKTWNARRGTQVVRPQPLGGAVPIPLFGRVAAGKPIEAVQSDEQVEVPPAMLRGAGPHFALKVVGDSMIEDGILDGDYVVIKKQAAAENGQTVVALINNEATIKRYYGRASRGVIHAVELHPANPKYKPIHVDAGSGDFKIEGVLMGVIRLCR